MKKLLQRWLGVSAPQDIPTDDFFAPVSGNASNGALHALSSVRRRNIIEILPSVNGQIVIFSKREDNPNGPDKNETVLYLVPEGENLIDTITKALVIAGLQ